MENPAQMSVLLPVCAALVVVDAFSQPSLFHLSEKRNELKTIQSERGRNVEGYAREIKCKD